MTANPKSLRELALLGTVVGQSMKGRPKGKITLGQQISSHNNDLIPLSQCPNP